MAVIKKTSAIKNPPKHLLGIQNLSKDVTQNITMWDERLSSEGAFNLSSNLDINVSKKVQKLDENAALFILQGALDYLNKNNT